jgi:hypothetical protein
MSVDRFSGTCHRSKPGRSPLQLLKGQSLMRTFFITGVSSGLGRALATEALAVGTVRSEAANRSGRPAQILVEGYRFFLNPQGFLTNQVLRII